MNNKIVSISGLDLAGKKTQSQILTTLLQKQYGGCTYIDTPSKTSIWGKLIGAMLDERVVHLSGCRLESGYSIVPGGVKLTELSYSKGDALRGGDYYGQLKKDGDVFSFAMLYAIEQRKRAKEAEDCLSVGHVVRDRAEADFITYQSYDLMTSYGLALEPEKYLEPLLVGCKPSDITIVLIPEKLLNRPGETPDCIERDELFNYGVAETFKYLAKRYNWHILEFHSSFSLSYNISYVTKDICRILTDNGLPVEFEQSVVDDYIANNIKGESNVC